jgi:hypothetical protein
MDFTEPLCKKMLDDVRQARLEGADINEVFFTMHPDPEINSFAADALVRKYEVSAEWESRHEIPIITDLANYQQEVFSNLLYFKIRKVELYILENQEELKKALEKEASPDDEIHLLMQKHNHLKQVSRELTGLIGTVVLK